MTAVASRIRNIALIAHGGAGKTTLIESLLMRAHEISAGAKEGPVMRVEPEEQTHKIAITPHIAHLRWREATINIVDTPGYFNFLESTRGVLPAVDAAILLVSAVEGVHPETERLWRMLQEAQVPVLCFLNQMDVEGADYMRALKSIESLLAVKLQPLTIPLRIGAKCQAVVDLLERKLWSNEGEGLDAQHIPAALEGDISALRTQLLERIVESNDLLLARYLGAEDISAAELAQALKEAVGRRLFVPLLCGSARSGAGVHALLDAIVSFCLCPLERDVLRPFVGKSLQNEQGGEQVVQRGIADAEFSAIVLKTVIDPYSGKLSVVRVVSGKVHANQGIYNSNQQSRQRTGHVYLVQGKALSPVDALTAGEIGAIAKLEDTHTGDTLCDPDTAVVYPKVQYAEPPVSYAVASGDAAQEEKVAAGLSKLIEEDPTLHMHRDHTSHEIILSGMGRVHIEIALERLTRKYGSKATLKTPRVPYRESIKHAIKVQGRLKKQSGGHGQFANCWLEVEPLPRNAGFEFEDCIVGGVIPKQYIPSIKKGVRDAMLKGPLGGHPVTDVRVRVVDGSFHDVDSSDYAFQVAGSLAFKAALEQAGALLLEPIMAIDIVVPEENVGDVLKDLTARRGRVLGMNTREREQEIEAEVPMAEVLDYGNVLSSLTAGRGVYSMSVSQYRNVPE